MPCVHHWRLDAGPYPLRCMKCGYSTTHFPEENKFMIKPIGNKVILTYEETEAKSHGGIILVESAKKKPNTGVVLAVGDGMFLKNGTLLRPDVSVGQRVMYDKFTATGVEHDGQKFVIVNAHELLGVFE